MLPKTYQILTNLDCNLNCTYCYEHKGRKHNDINAIKQFIDQAAQEPTKEIYLDLIGGETLLYPELLDEICSYTEAKNKPFLISLSTNGTLIAESQKVRDTLTKWKNNIALGFSIDGTKEIHDSCRKDKNGKGSYDKAVQGWNWAKNIIRPCRLGVKATYCHKTINNYAEGVINLIKLGFTDIAANTVFEEIWTMEDALTISQQMNTVTDYLFEHNLQNKVHILQINNKNIDMRHYNPITGPKTANYCGSCKYMRCLGYDNTVYGCNRFCTMDKPIPLGKLTEQGIQITNNTLLTEIENQHKKWPEECKTCPYGEQCSSCSAIAYEQNGAESYYAAKPQCGFTYAVVIAKLYYKLKLMKEEIQK